MKSMVRFEEFSLGFEGNHRPVQALDTVNLRINAAETTVIAGESGAGKSVLAHSLLGFWPRNAVIRGDISILGRSVRKFRANEWSEIRGRKIGLVVQDPHSGLNPLYSVREQILESVRTANRAYDEQDLQELLRTVGFQNPEELLEKNPHELSGGMAQRVLLAVMLACGPEYLVVDEPTKGLDGEQRRRTLDLLSELGSGDQGMLVITHDLEAALELADKIIVMRGGRIEDETTPVKIRHGEVTGYTERLFGILQDEPQPNRDQSVSEETCLLLEGVTKQFNSGFFGFRKIPVLGGVDLRIQRGEVVGLMGDSGSGKTTLARIIQGTLEADRGRVTLSGSFLPKGRVTEFRARTVQTVGQDPRGSFHPRRILRESVMEPASYHGLYASESELQSTLEGWIERFEVDFSCLERYPHQVSGGQLQRLALVRALLIDPELLILDEPVSMLDRLTGHRILKMLTDFQKERSLTMLHIAHNPDELRRTCDRLLCLDDGVLKSLKGKESG